MEKFSKHRKNLANLGKRKKEEMKRVKGNAINMVGGKTNSRSRRLASQKKYSSKKFHIHTGILITAAALLLVVAFIIFALFSDHFMLKRVKIDGMIRSNSFDILSQAAIEQNKNIFLISREDIKNNIERDKLIMVRSVSISPPDMISISIEERETIALLEYSGGLVEITKDNYILNKERIYNYNLPYLKGFDIDLQSDIVENNYTLYIIKLLANLYENNADIFNMISEIDVSGQDLVLYTRGYNVKVLMPHYTTEKKFIDLAAILTLLKATEEQVVQIDNRFENAVIKYR